MLLAPRGIAYDVLVMALRSQANHFRTPGVKQHCHTIDSRKDADSSNRKIRIHILQSAAEKADLFIAIVGGGATGVGLAAVPVQRAESGDVYGAPGLSPRIQITLIESGAGLLAAFPKDISEAARQRLERIGVAVKTGVQVSAAEAARFCLKTGELLPAMHKVWAAEVRAPEYLKEFDGRETGNSNRRVVQPCLQTTRDPCIFAVGDCASLKLPGMERPLPALTQAAHQQAKHPFWHLSNWLQGKPMPDFTHHNFVRIAGPVRPVRACWPS